MTPRSTSTTEPPIVAATPDARTPRAVRVPLPGGAALDPFALAGGSGLLLAHGGRILVGLGRALKLDLPGGLAGADDIDAVTRLLASIPCDDRAGAAPGATGHAVMAFGALPFDRDSAASLIVPELTYGQELDGTEWVTVVAADGSGLPDPDDPATAISLRQQLSSRVSGDPAGPGSPCSPVVQPLSTDNEFLSSLGSAVDAIRRNEVVKVVLSRSVDVRMDQEVDVPALLRRWASLEPNCTIFAVPTDVGRFVGASPELLIERKGDRFRSRPLAGTTDRLHGAGSALPETLLDSAKDGEEHRLVVDAIRDELAPLCAALSAPEQPELVHLHAITHLGTAIDGTLRHASDGSVPSALQLVARLHPTPAVGGVPREAATELIRRLEPTPRGPYAGPVGYVDASGDGRWMVGIRAMTVDGRSVRMTAGVGIVAGSDPSIELLETRLKFSTVFDALAPGGTFITDRPHA
jgi:menaquinone-specific isochorismate synthase